MDTKMAFTIVLNELSKCPLFIGKHDVKNGNINYMYGILTIMENIAYNVDTETGHSFNEMFLKNLIESDKKALQTN